MSNIITTSTKHEQYPISASMGTGNLSLQFALKTKRKKCRQTLKCHLLHNMAFCVSEYHVITRNS